MFVSCNYKVLNIHDIYEDTFIQINNTNQGHFITTDLDLTSDHFGFLFSC